MQRLLLVLICLGATGCASITSFKSLPQSGGEYILEKSLLAEKYPEIPLYEKSWRGFSPEFPSERSLVEHLGEPTKKERDWTYPAVVIGTLVVIQAQPIVWGLVAFVRPDTPKNYYFSKGEYCIKSRMDRTALNFYEQHMVSWEWEKNTDRCN